MSTDQQSKPRLAKKAIAEESGRPGTWRSKVGCEAMDEPCTNRIVPRVFAGSPRHFSNMNSLAAPPSLVVQCSSPLMAGVVMSFIADCLVDVTDVVVADDLRPFGDLVIL